MYINLNEFVFLLRLIIEQSYYLDKSGCTSQADC